MATYTQLGLEMVVLRAGAAVSLISRITRGVGTLSDTAEEAAVASLRSSRAYKEVANALDEMSAAQREAAEASLELAEAQVKQEAQTKKQHLAFVITAQALSYVVKGLQDVAAESLAVSSAEQTQSKSTATLARNYGVTRSEVESYVKAIKAQTFTTAEALTAVGNLATAEVDLAESVQLAAIANDIAAQRGLEAGEVLNVLTTAITNQSYSALNQIGITESAEVAFRRYAEQIGTTREELDGADRSQAVLNTVLQKGAAFAGAYDSIQGDLARSTRELDIELIELYGTIGNGLLPVVERITESGRDALEVLNDLPPGVKDAAIAVTAGVGAASALFVGLATLAPVAALFTKAFAAVAGVAGGPAMAAALLAIAAIGTALVVAAKRKKELDEELAKGVELPVVSTAEVGTFESGLRERAEAEDAYWRQAYTREVAAVSRSRNALNQQLDDIEAHRRGVEQEIQRIEDAVYKIDLREFFLNELLTPFENRLARITAEINKTLIPLQRRERLLRRELDAARDIADEEKERRKKLIEQLQEQIDLVRELLEEDRERLSLINHELFMEGLHNKILKRATSAKELELRGQKALQEDIVATRSEELAATRDQVKEEKAKLKGEENIAQAQLEAAEKRLQAVQLDIDLQQEKVTYAREELLLAEGRQVEDRISLSILERRAELQSMMIGREDTLLARQEKSLERQRDLLNEQIKYMQDALDEAFVFDVVIPENAFASYYAQIDNAGAAVEEWSKNAAQYAKDVAAENARLALVQDTLLGELTKTASRKLDESLEAAGKKYDAWLGEQVAKSGTAAAGAIVGFVGSLFSPSKFQGFVDTVLKIMQPILNPKTLPHEDDLAPWWDTPVVTENAKDFVKGFGDLWRDWGYPVFTWEDVDEFLRPFEALSAKVISSAYAADAEIRDKLGMRSPSKVTEAIGEDIAAGFGVGFGEGMEKFRRDAVLEIDRTAELLRKKLGELSLTVSPTAQVTLSPLLSQTARQVMGESRQASVVNNYNTYQGAQIDFNAAYAKAQSPSSVLDDLQMISAVI